MSKKLNLNLNNLEENVAELNVDITPMTQNETFSSVQDTVPVVKIGLDIGASSVKVSYFDGSNVIKDFNFPNRINVEISNGDGNTIEVDNEVIKVASIGGVSNANPKKVNYRYIKHILLNVAYILKKELNISRDIALEIKTCLPPKQFKDTKEEYKELLEKCSCQGTVNKETFNLEIKSVKCGAEGIVLLKSFNINNVANDLMKIMLIEVGSSTTEIVLLELVGDNTWKIKNATSSAAAGASMCKDIEAHLNKTTKGNYHWDDLELLGKFQLKQEVKSITEHANAINNTVKELLHDIDSVGTFDEYMPLLGGRGSSVLAKNDFFKEITPFLVVDEINKIYGNSRGCLLS